MEQLQIGDGEMRALHVRDMVGSTGVPTGQQPQPARQQASQQRRGGQSLSRPGNHPVTNTWESGDESASGTSV